jgi:hypothetical protein
VLRQVLTACANPRANRPLRLVPTVVLRLLLRQLTRCANRVDHPVANRGANRVANPVCQPGANPFANIHANRNASWKRTPWKPGLREDTIPLLLVEAGGGRKSGVLKGVEWC